MSVESYPSHNRLGSSLTSSAPHFSASLVPQPSARRHAAPLLIVKTQCTVWPSLSSCLAVITSFSLTEVQVQVQRGAGQSTPPRRLRPECGPISHPQRNPSECWYFIVMRGVTKTRSYPHLNDETVDQVKQT